MIRTTTTDADGNAVRQDFAWSFSHIKNYETCPFRYQQIDLLKNYKEEKSAELQEGFYIHDCMAKRINGKVPLPPGVPYEHWAVYAESGDGPTRAELKLAMTKHFTPCEYFDKIKKVWLRSVADTLRIWDNNCHIIDWKTGKIKPDPEQLLLAGTCVMVHYPEVYNIKAEFIWLSHNTKTTLECTVDDIVNFWGTTMFDKVNKLQEARNIEAFPKKPSGLCKRWCIVTECEHCGQ